MPFTQPQKFRQDQKSEYSHRRHIEQHVRDAEYLVRGKVIHDEHDDVNRDIDKRHDLHRRCDIAERTNETF